MAGLAPGEIGDEADGISVRVQSVLIAVGANAQANFRRFLPVAPVAATAASAASADTNSTLDAANHARRRTANAAALAAAVTSDPVQNRPIKSRRSRAFLRTTTGRRRPGYTFFRFYVAAGRDGQYEWHQPGNGLLSEGRWIGGGWRIRRRVGIGRWGAARYVQAMGGPAVPLGGSARTRNLGAWPGGQSELLPQTSSGGHQGASPTKWAGGSTSTSTAAASRIG